MSNVPFLPSYPYPFPAFYDHLKGTYLLDTDSGWVQLGKEDIRLHMSQAGWDNRKDSNRLSILDRELMRIQIEQKIDYSGPVAGHKKGLIVMGGSKVLVTRSYQPGHAEKGDWSLINTIIENLLGRVDPLQVSTFYSWCKVYLESLRDNVFVPGQAMILAGPHDCGKSFLQNSLTVLFGGRSANPWPYMSGRTEFNSDLFGAEHMQVEDPPVSLLSDRLDFAARIKQFTVNEIQPCHGKNRDIVTIQPRWRLTISINDEPYNLRAIPPIDDSTSDKVIIFKCAKDSIPWHAESSNKREAARLIVLSQIPAFAFFLLNEWVIPPSIFSGRFGVTHYHHSDILTEITNNSDDLDLLRFLQELGDFSEGQWQATLREIRTRFRTCGDEDAKALAERQRSFELKLSYLAKRFPEIIRRKHLSHSRLWCISKEKGSEDSKSSESCL